MRPERYRPTRAERLGSETASPSVPKDRSVKQSSSAEEVPASSAPVSARVAVRPAPEPAVIASPGIPLVRQLKIIAARLGSGDSAPETSLKGLSELIIGSAHAAYVDIPNVPLTGIVAHLLITASLMRQNPGLSPDLSLDKLRSLLRGDSGVVPLPKGKEEREDARKRPDLSRIASREFWEIKSEYSVKMRASEIAKQIQVYAKMLNAGGALVGLPGSISEGVRGVKLRCSFRLSGPGVIAYDAEFDIGDAIRDLGRKIVEEFIRETRKKVAELSKRLVELLDDPLFLALLFALAVLVVLALFWAPIAAAVSAAAMAALELLEVGGAALVL